MKLMKYHQTLFLSMKGGSEKKIMEAKIMGQPAALRTPIEYAFLEGIGIL